MEHADLCEHPQIREHSFTQVTSAIFVYAYPRLADELCELVALATEVRNG